MKMRGQPIKGKRDDLPWSCDSKMEANCGRILCFRQDKGEIIKLERCDWRNEEHWITFPDVDRGTMGTALDFRFQWADKPGEWVWVEVKGEFQGKLDAKSKTRLRRLSRKRKDIFDKTIFICKTDKNVWAHYLPKKRDTAHSFLLGNCKADPEQIWLYEQLVDLYAKAVCIAGYQWEK